MQRTDWPDLTELEGDAELLLGAPVHSEEPGEQQKSHPHTDLGNAELLIELYGKDLRYCSAWNCWLVWDETRWVRDSKGILAGRLANLAARERYRQAADIDDSELRRATVAWARRSESTSARFNCLAQAMTLPGVAIEVSTLDADPWLLNVKNGTLDLRTGQLRAHSREDFLTKMAPVAYHPQALAPTWLRMLEEIFQGQASLIQFVQRALGYSLTGDTRERVFFMNHGEGRNGKSTVLETILAVLGQDYAVVINPDVLMSSKRDGDSPCPQLADLRGARFVLTSESRRGAQLDESVVKRLTGGTDTIVARRLNENPIRFRPTHKIWLATNHRPVIEEATPAIWDRICLLPYEVRFAKPDLELPQRLLQEAEGVLAWLVQGCLRWLDQGLQPPAEVRAATSDYRQDSDELALFLEERTRPRAEATVSLDMLYQKYCEWSQQFGEKVKSGREFSKMLKERGFEQKRTKKCFVWCGLELASVAPGDPSKITRSPQDHPVDHPSKPGRIRVFSPGDLSDPQIRSKSMDRIFLHGPHGRNDHQDHPSTSNPYGQRLFPGDPSGALRLFEDHPRSPRSPEPEVGLP